MGIDELEVSSLDIVQKKAESQKGNAYTKTVHQRIP
jgi:hypothetical protein